MDLIFLPLIIAFLLTLLFTPATIKLAKKYKLLDDPDKRPHPAHIHKRVIPRAGGLAIYLSVVISSLIFLPIEKHLIGIFLGMSILLIVGLIDDKLPSFNPYLRLFLLFLAAGAAVASGIGISFISNPLANLSFLPPEITTPILRFDRFAIPINFFGPHYIVLIADIFAFLWIVTLTQVINWSKGIDGQMPGITLMAALTLGFLSLKLFLQGDPNQLNIARFSFITAGVSLGFLIFNWYPAKILPGFSGSTILAFLLATLSILSGAKVATALLVLSIPAVDFGYTILRRISTGRSPVWGDKGHLHHRLLAKGWSHSQIALFYILFSAILGAVGIFIDTQSKFFAGVVVLVIFVGIILWLNSFGGLLKQSDPDNG